MFNLYVSGQAHHEQLPDGTSLYDYHYQTPPIHSFKAACEPSTWRHHYKPFAVAINQPKTGEVMLIRDHLGVAPLYYYHTPGKKLIIAETIPLIIEQLSSPPFLHKQQIHMLFSREKYYSDETFYEGIYRVEPGHMMHFKHDGSVEKKAYWQLEVKGDVLHYSDDRDYLAHFSELMKESTLNAIDDQTNLAAEFSAGLDSSAVYCCLRELGINPTLYMHIAKPGTQPAQLYNSQLEESFIEHFQQPRIQRIGDENFEPIQVFTQYAKWFGGSAPYMFPMFASNIHRAVAANKHPILLSGFGGDQGVSSNIGFNYCIPELMHQKKFRDAWNQLTVNQDKTQSPVRWLKNGVHFCQYAHPALYQMSISRHQIKQIINDRFAKNSNKTLSYHPQKRLYFNTEREGMRSILQGPHSSEIRMRIEYSSVVAKQLGFEFRYPLLYPKLLEFFLSLPLTQKKRHGVGRYLMRQYLSRTLPEDIIADYKKSEGLAIAPSTFELYQRACEENQYKEEFSELPYSHLIQAHNPGLRMKNLVKGFMLKQGVC
ncbi:MAG: asparagine synthase-related protein [Legionella sp.]|nr:asparagine synthase-related protein [Legionella sp.]